MVIFIHSRRTTQYTLAAVAVARVHLVLFIFNPRGHDEPHPTVCASYVGSPVSCPVTIGPPKADAISPQFCFSTFPIQNIKHEHEKYMHAHFGAASNMYLPTSLAQLFDLMYKKGSLRDDQYFSSPHVRVRCGWTDEVGGGYIFRGCWAE